MFDKISTPTIREKKVQVIKEVNSDTEDLKLAKDC